MTKYNNKESNFESSDEMIKEMNRFGRNYISEESDYENVESESEEYFSSESSNNWSIKKIY